jgi:hypothetical protein
MNDAGKLVKAIRGVTANYRSNKKGNIVYVKIGLELSDLHNPVTPLLGLMDKINLVQRRVIDACAQEFLPD